MSISRFILEKEIEKYERYINQGREDINDLQYQLDQRSKMVEKWEQEKQELINTISSLNGE